MNWYRVLVNGRNFHIEMDGEQKHLGFYTARYVEADSVSEAEARAIETIHRDPQLKTNFAVSGADAPQILCDEVELLEGPPEDEDGGLVFYPAEEDFDH